MVALAAWFVPQVSVSGQPAPARGMSLDEVVRAIEANPEEPVGVLDMARKLCLTFDVSANEALLRNAGAKDRLLDALRLVCRVTNKIAEPVPRDRVGLRQQAEEEVPKPLLPVMPSPSKTPSPAKREGPALTRMGELDGEYLTWAQGTSNRANRLDRPRSQPAGDEGASRNRDDSVKAAKGVAADRALRDPSRKVADGLVADSGRNATMRDARLAAGELLPPRSVFSNPSAVAVVIGNRTYRDAGVPSVDHAGNDARKVKEYLVTAFGFRPEHVIFREDATLSTFQQIFGKEDDWQGELYNVLDPRPGTSDVFVFYSGHGAPDPGGSRKSFLVPSDANPDRLTLTGFSVKTLYGNLAKLPARSVTVVLDASFSGVTPKGALFKGMSPVGVDYDAPEITSRNLTVLTASAKNQVSHWYEEREHGLFTYVFLQPLQRSLDATNGRVVPSARQLADSLGFEVNRLSVRLSGKRQNPQVFGEAQNQPLPFLRR